MKNKESIEKKMIYSTKWTTFGEIMAKLIAPITNLILARLLIPSDFGIVATITMIISFADIFSDIGFQKFIIQADIEERDLDKYANVAFWTNIFTSVVIWCILFISRSFFSNVLNMAELKSVLPFATIPIIISSLSTIQVAIFRKNFLFKNLFFIRLIGLVVPMLVTIPLAFMGFKFWSIIIGNIALSILNTILLTIFSKWRPSFFYSLEILKKMMSFSLWTLVEGIAIWLTSWIDTFIIGTKLTSTDLGVYKTGTTNINGIMSLVTASTTPVLFSGLSKLKNEDEKFLQVFFKMQRWVSIILFPLGVGIYVFRELASRILLGPGWGGAAEVIGNWALTSSIMIVLGNYCSEVYRAKGKPKLSFLAQILHLIFLVPIIYFSAAKGLRFLVIVRSWSRLQFILVHIFILKKYFDFPVIKMFKNISVVGFSAVIMGFIASFLLNLSDSIPTQIIWILISISFYIVLLLIFPSTRKDLIVFFKLIRKKGI
ncbi:lipopolysaccharide biosynthesis protein [Enterococcus casseliflavus]|nr:lipopolysaccharide biosynthesis protein [Enterococcus casseliflavus]